MQITVTVDPKAITVYCPHCGAYLFTLGATGVMECDQYTGNFLVTTESEKKQ
jgi:hypothetical protein